MSIIESTVNQTAFLFGLIIIGYVLVKLKVLPDNSAAVLSKLENVIFIPALVMGTFIENFTVERISGARTLLMVSGIIALVAAAIYIPTDYPSPILALWATRLSKVFFRRYSLNILYLPCLFGCLFISGVSRSCSFRLPAKSKLLAKTSKPL